MLGHIDNGSPTLSIYITRNNKSYYSSFRKTTKTILLGTIGIIYSSIYSLSNNTNRLCNRKYSNYIIIIILFSFLVLFLKSFIRILIMKLFSIISMVGSTRNHYSKSTPNMMIFKRMMMISKRKMMIFKQKMIKCKINTFCSIIINSI